jgi:lipoate---protein ligase
MLIIHRQETDPFFNIAAEEYLLKNFTGDIFTVWVDDPCVVAGKHQNTLAEINYRIIRDNAIPVIRRITGGGTVFHDHGNLNYSFITSGEPGKLVDYQRWTSPLVSYLATKGIIATLEDKSNLVIDGRKFSGNSAHVHRNRVIHHGTILYDSDLHLLGNALRREKEIYHDKAVKSRKAVVTNILDHMKIKTPIIEFSKDFLAFILNNYPGSSIYELNKDDHMLIRKLAEEKYRTWEWNYGYSPDYKLENDLSINGETWNIKMAVSKGIILDLEIRNDFGDHLEAIEKTLRGVAHDENSISGRLRNVNFAGSNEIEPISIIQYLF